MPPMAILYSGSRDKMETGFIADGRGVEETCSTTESTVDFLESDDVCLDFR